MAPTVATARRAAAAGAARPHHDAPRSTPRRAPLRVVPSHGREAGRRGQRTRRSFTRFLPLTLIVTSLLVVVVGQAMLANGQVRMSGLQQQLTIEQGVHRQQELAVSQLEMPSRIVSAATTTLHMVRPGQVLQLPYVSLDTPIPTPTVTPAPGTPTATTTAPTAGQ
jgi:hypothetical protein